MDIQSLSQSIVLIAERWRLTTFTDQTVLLSKMVHFSQLFEASSQVKKGPTPF